MKTTKFPVFWMGLNALFFCLPLLAEAPGYPAGKDDMSKEHKKWLEEEVVYIISESEKEVFKSLTTSRQREEFIESFWKRRDPHSRHPFQ